jgi:putative ATP-binding cassette transporter
MFFFRAHAFLAYAIGLAVSMPLYLIKVISLGVVMQTSSAFNSVNSAFSVFIEFYGDFAEWRSVVYRLSEFTQKMDKIQSEPSSAIVMHEQDTQDIIVSNLTLALPNGQLLMENVNEVFPRGKATLLTGVSGIGKTTFLRALANLWPYGSGSIAFPRHSKRLFLPQKPYLPLGTLKEALFYPNPVMADDVILKSTLKIIGLSRLENQLNENKNWAQELSQGEQQLIAFARVLLVKPDILFLDEATAALDEETEAKMYKILREYLPHATIISVGHRSSLGRFHDQVMVLENRVASVRCPVIPASS